MLRPIALAVAGHLAEGGLDGRREDLDRQRQSVPRLEGEHPREESVVAVGFDEVILGEPLEELRRGFVYRERVSPSLLPEEVALPHARADRRGDLPGGADAERARRRPVDRFEGRAPRRDRLV